MKIKTIRLGIIPLVLAALLSGCSPQATETPPSDTAAPVVAPSGSPVESEDFVESLLFFGESTTYHMKSRGVLSGGTETKQVWAPRSGTVCLDESIRSVRIVLPETGEELSLRDALAKKKPKRMLLTFGLNGVIRKYSKGQHYYNTCYRMLIDLIRTASPSTEIYLGTCYPVASNMDTAAYGVSAATINQYLNTLNLWCRELAEAERIGYFDFASALKDANGFLRTEYQVGDGIHLTREAYLAVLSYIRAQESRCYQEEV